MPKSLLVLLCLVVGVIQVGIFWAAESRQRPAQHLVRSGETALALITSAEGEIIDGKSHYVVRYQSKGPQGPFQGEEFFSMRHNDPPRQGQRVTCYFDPQNPSLNTITDPRLVMQRIATLKLLSLGFGAFTYAFLWVIWRSQKHESQQEKSP